MDNGEWRIQNVGRWVGDRGWIMDNGIQRVEDGLWSIEDGVWNFEDS